MILLILFVLSDFLTFGDVVFLFFFHLFILTFRLYAVSKYKKDIETIIDSKAIGKWKSIFMFGSFMSGLAWGIIFFYMTDVPSEYHFFVYAIVAGLAAIAMSTLGVIFSVYLSFMLPILGIPIFWLTLNEGTIYKVAVISLLIGISYYIVSVRRFSKNFKTIFIEEERIRLLQERMDLALNGSNTSILDWNITNNNFYISQSWKELIGYRDDELPNKLLSWRQHVHHDDRKPLFSSLKKHMSNQIDIFENVHRLRHKDGHYIWILGRAKIIYNESGKAVRMIGTHTDITTEKDLQIKYSQQAQIIEQTHDSVITTDFDGVITSWNHGSTLIFGYTAEEAIGQHISMVHRKEDFEEGKKSLEILMATGEYRTEAYRITKSGESIYVLLSLSVLKDENGNPIKLVGFAQDITKRKKAQDKLLEQKDILDYQAHHDDLTGLPNRVLFNDRLNQAIQKSKRTKTQFALLFLDLDHFKEINDSLGHNIGDEILKRVTLVLNEVIREKDTLARLGGDEFTIIMEDLKQGQDASLLANKILEALKKPIIINDTTLYISSSIGISLYPIDGESTQNLLKYADAAMYRAKDEGRNNFQFYSSEMTELAFERVVMEASLRSGLLNNEFVVYYQPQVNGKSGEIIGMEALVRWDHPTMGLVSPAKFIPLAESTGLIVELDQFVMKTAMKQISKWCEDGLNPGVLALNLAVKQLQQKEFISILKNIIRETKCRPDLIELEVTESQIMTNPEEAINILNQISDLGIELAIDDFGTGYSSLSYLKKLPINKLKIDQSFIRDLPDDEEDVGITKAVIALAKSLNLKIIAEGVETKEQKEFLVQNGCNNIQGYFYAKPIPASDMEVILREGFSS